MDSQNIQISQSIHRIHHRKPVLSRKRTLKKLNHSIRMGAMKQKKEQIMHENEMIQRRIMGVQSQLQRDEMIKEAKLRKKRYNEIHKHQVVGNRQIMSNKKLPSIERPMTIKSMPSSIKKKLKKRRRELAKVKREEFDQEATKYLKFASLTGRSTKSLGHSKRSFAESKMKESMRAAEKN